MLKKYIIIGKIISTHGVKGCIKIYSFTTPINNIFKYKCIYIYYKILQKIELIKKSENKNIFITSVSNVTTKTKAEYLKSKFIYTKICLLNNLHNNEYYWKDLLNLHVINNKNNNHHGKIINIFSNNEYNILVIKTNENKLQYIPYIKKIYIKNVDLLNKKIFINLI